MVSSTAKTQSYLHEATRDGLEKGMLCNLGTLKKFPLTGEQSFAAQTQKDENQKQVKYYTFAPNAPPIVTKPMLQYKRDIKTAPYRAMLPRAKNMNDVPQKLTIGWRNRIRSQVGQTNRWRLSQWLGTDLLGTSQAVRATVEIPAEDIIPKVDFYALKRQKSSATTVRSEATEGDLDLLEADDGLSDVAGLADDQDTEPELAFDSEKPSNAQSPAGSSLPPISSQSKTRKTVDRKLRLLSDVDRDPKPVTVRSFTPFRETLENQQPDFFLNCMGFDFELNYSVITRSKLLNRLILGDTRTSTAHHKSQFTKRQSMLMAHGVTKEVVRVNTMTDTMCRDLHSMTREISAVLLETLPKHNLVIPENMDYKVTPNGLAVVLANLYRETMSIHATEAPDVFEAAKFLEFRQLKYMCLEVMMCNVKASTVGLYCQLADKHRLTLLNKACVRWLAYNLITEMSERMELSQLSLNDMQATISHKHLYVKHEFSLYQTLCTWLYLQVNKPKQVPPFGTIVTYFNSLPKWVSFLGRDESAAQYMPLFSQLRLHALTDPTHLECLQKMNVMPQNWVLNLVTMNYRSLQVGGDMSLVMAFESSAARYGLEVTDNSRIADCINLHGFFFETSATPVDMPQTNRSTSAPKEQPAAFYLQIRRLKPTDTALNLGSREKFTFSMRQDRELMYGITVQWFDPRTNQFCSSESPIKRQRFGFSLKTCKSEVFEIRPGTLPFRVTFALFFPPS